MQSRAAYHGDKMLTLFTWGYWGWGTSTRELVRAVDATEKKRGFEPPIFVDIRLRRSVRAPGFSGNAFAHVVGASRYQWMPRLGNRRIALGESGVQIDDPSAARDLIRLAIECARRHQRVLFFCACEDLATKRCHRTKVADLVLKEAAQQRRRVEIVEWPGSKPTYTTLAVTPEILKGIACGRKSVPLDSIDLKEFAGLPWGSVVTLHAGEQALPIVTGPAKYHRDWCLQVVHSGEIGGDAGHLKRWGAKFRKAKGLEYRRL
jgi:hypothetical protein